MRAIKTAQVAVARDFFRGEIQLLLEKQHISAQVESLEYLTNLMIRYMDSETFFVRKPQGKLEDNVLAHLYTDYIEGSTEKKENLLTTTGRYLLTHQWFFRG